MHGDSDFGSKFGGRDEIGGVQKYVTAMHSACERIEREIDGETAPGGLFHGSKAHFGGATQIDAGWRTQFEIAAVVQTGDIEAETAKIVGQKDGAADF